MNNEKAVVNSDEIISDFGENIKDIKLLRKHTESNFLTDKGYITVENTNNGQVTNIKLEGKTTLNPRIEVKGLFDYLDPLVTLPDKLKPSTTYTFFIRNHSGIYLILRPNADVFTETNQYDTNEYERPIIFSVTTKDVISSSNILISEGDGVINTDFTLIILEGKHSNQPASYFECLKSVGDSNDKIEILSKNKNLVYNSYIGETGSGSLGNGLAYPNMFTFSDTRYRTNYIINVKPLTTYYIKFNENIDKTKWKYAFCELSKSNIQLKDTDWISSSVNTHTTSDNVYGLVLIVAKADNSAFNINEVNDLIQVCSDDIDFSYSDYTKKQVLFKNKNGSYEKVVLRGLPDGVKDSIEKHSDGKYYYHKRCRELVFDGSDDEGWHNIPYFDGSSVKFYIIAIDGGTIDATSCNLMTNIFNAFPTDDSREFNKNNNLEGAYWGDNTSSILQVHISNTKASSVENFKTWLSKNPMTVVYQLATEEVYECTNIDLDCFEGETSVICNSNIPPSNMSFKVANHISNTVEVMKDRISDIETKIIEMLSSDMNQSIQVNGYKILPGGMILQWGEYNVAAQLNTMNKATIKFPITFPHFRFGFYTTLLSNTYDEQKFSNLTVSSESSWDTSQAEVKVMCNSQGATTLAFKWFAIGY